MPIYTKTGDQGETSLFGGQRVRKSSDLVQAYGSVDELNSWVGVVVASVDNAHQKEFLEKIQSDLFIIGGNLAGWETDLSVLPTRVTEMEVEIDAMEESLTPMRNFILPGGSMAAAQIHVTRSVVRRVERLVVALAETQSVNPIIMQYLNRLSDLFFVLARFINKERHVEDIPWIGIPRDDKK